MELGPHLAFRHLPTALPTNAIFQFDRDTLFDVKGEVQVRWAVVPDPQKYVTDVLALEAGDVPVEKTHRGTWVLDKVLLDDIKIDVHMASEHDSDARHVKRRDDFMASIRAGKEIKPLIVLGADLFLVDGYARYRALKDLTVC